MVITEDLLEKAAPIIEEVYKNSGERLAYRLASDLEISERDLARQVGIKECTEEDLFLLGVFAARYFAQCKMREEDRHY